MNGRDVLLGIGFFAAIGGIAMAFAPGLAGGIDAPALFPLALGVIALFGAITRGQAWLYHEEREFNFGERERPGGIDAPGGEFDRILKQAPGMGTGGGNSRSVVVRQSLREAAIEALVTHRGYTREAARSAVSTGTWTDDDYAAEFFTTTSGAGSSLSESVTSTFYGDAPFHRRADHAAREIERLTRGER